LQFNIQRRNLSGRDEMPELKRWNNHTKCS
jgi:hypothetical protein